MAELKTKSNQASVAEFVSKIPDPQRRKDCAELLRMMKRATQARPTMWGTSVVGFGRYHYKYDSGREGDWFITGFSPRKNDLTIYLLAGCDRFPALMKKLGKHKTGRSCLYLKSLDDVDAKVLQRLVEKSVAAMASKRVDR